MDKEGERDYKEYMFGGLVKEVCNPEGRQEDKIMSREKPPWALDEALITSTQERKIL